MKDKEKNTPLRTIDFFCGAGGMGLGFKQAGFELAGAYDFDKFAIQSYQHNISADAKQQDIREMVAEDVSDAEVWTFGFPCFPEDTLILTEDGLRGISEVKVGDRVLTHKNRYQRVTKVMKRKSPLWRLEGEGHPALLTTSEHPFWSMQEDAQEQKQAMEYEAFCSSMLGDYSAPSMGPLPVWTPAHKMAGRYWASPSTFPTQNVSDDVTPSLLWMTGVWLRNGWLDGITDDLTPKVSWYLNEEEIGPFSDELKKAGFQYETFHFGQLIRVVVADAPLTDFLLTHFSDGGGKRIPGWAYGMNQQNTRSLFSGFRFCRGNDNEEPRMKNKGLLIGMKLLAQSMGLKLDIHKTMEEEPSWTFSFITNDSFRSEGHVFAKVSTSQPLEEEATVFNLVVEEDNSYVADALTVHNCQDISTAGKQLGMIKGETRSGMFYEIMRLLEETQEHVSRELPQVILAENVKMVRKYLPIIQEEYEKNGYVFFYTLYNSKFWGVPQNRERYFMLGVRQDIWEAKGDFAFPVQDESNVPNLSSILQSSVDEKYYITEEKSRHIIEEALQRVELEGVHACLSVDRGKRRQNGRRAKTDEESMYTLTTADRHGIIHKRVDDQGRVNKPVKLHDISPCLRAEEHGNNKKVIEKRGNIQVVGRLDMKGNDCIRRVYDPSGISPTLTTSQGGHRQPKVLLSKELEQALIEQVAADVLEVAQKKRPNDEVEVKIQPNGNIRPHRTDARKSGLSELNVCHEKNEGFTCTSSHANTVYGQSTDFRVRKLTPREYARLQGFADDYEQIVSDSQFYRQMGNAVSVNVSHVIAEAISSYLKREPDTE